MPTHTGQKFRSQISFTVLNRVLVISRDAIFTNLFLETKIFLELIFFALRRVSWHLKFEYAEGHFVVLSVAFNLLISVNYYGWGYHKRRA